MTLKRVQKKIGWTPEEKARHNAIREVFKNEPSIEELVAKGELSGRPLPLGTYVNLRLLVTSLRTIREQANLSLADVSERSGMDKAMLSRLENGHVADPGIETVSRYLHAVNKDIEWRVVDAPTPRPKGAPPVSGTAASKS